MGSRSPAVWRALEKEVRLFAASAAVNSPGVSMTALITLMVVSLTVDVETMETGVLVGMKERKRYSLRDGEPNKRNHNTTYFWFKIRTVPD